MFIFVVSLGRGRVLLFRSGWRRVWVFNWIVWVGVFVNYRVFFGVRIFGFM